MLSTARERSVRVLQIGKFYPPHRGGIETVTEQLNDCSHALGIRCDVLCSNETNRRAVERSNGHVIYRAASLAVIASTSLSLDYLRLLRRLHNRYDILHVHLPNPLANLGLFLVRPKAKIILHWHSDVVRQKGLLLFYEPFLVWLIRRAHLIVGATENHINRSRYQRYFSGKYRIVPYFVPVRKPGPVVRAPADRAGRIILALGRLVYYKGFEYLVEAAAHLDDRYEVLIAGDGPLRRHLERKVEQTGMRGRVRLLGPISEGTKDHLLRSCDVFCLPSTHKGEMFGVVQLEAMAFGKPVVSTEIPGSGVSCVNRDGITGYVVPIKDPKALAEAIRQICEDAAEYQRLSRNAYRNVVENYSPEAVTRRYAEVFGVKR